MEEEVTLLGFHEPSKTLMEGVRSHDYFHRSMVYSATPGVKKGLRAAKKSSVVALPHPN